MVGLPLVMSAVAIVAGLKARRTAALVRDTRIQPLGMAPDGYGRFEGRADAIDGEPLRAPFTGAECVWYSASLEEWRRTNDRRREWQTVRDTTSPAPILFRDATGAALVYVDGAEVTPTDKSRWTGAAPEPADRTPPRLAPTESFDTGLQIASTGGHRFRYTESRIYAGDPLLVLGEFSSGRFTSSEDEEDEPGESLDETDEDASEAPGPWAADGDRAEVMTRAARRITRASITSGGKKRPLVVAAAAGATHEAMNEMGAQAAFTVALVPLAIAALVLLARFR